MRPYAEEDMGISEYHYMVQAPEPWEWPYPPPRELKMPSRSFGSANAVTALGFLVGAGILFAALRFYHRELTSGERALLAI